MFQLYKQDKIDHFILLWPKYVITRTHQLFLLQDTCVGFLLGGIGELNKNRQPNFMVVDKSELKKKTFFLFAVTNP